MKNQSKGLNGMAGESVTRKVRATQGCDPRRIRVTQTPRPEEWAALRAWVEEGLERSGQRSGPGCKCSTCVARGASRAPGAE